MDYSWIIEKLAGWCLGDWALVLTPVAILLFTFISGPDRKEFIKTVKQLWVNVIGFFPRVSAYIGDMKGVSKKDVKALVRYILIDEVIDRILDLIIELVYDLLPFYYAIEKARGKKRAEK